MRINDANQQPISNQPVRGKEPNRVEAGYQKIRESGVDAGSGATDTFTLSSLSTAINGETEGSPERSAKIDKLAKEVDAGRYRPDSKVISKKLVEDALRKGGPELPPKSSPKVPDDTK